MYWPLKLKIDELLAAADAEGLHVALYCATRSLDQQSRYYAQGRTAPGRIVTNAAPGFSWHNYGLAADIVFQVNYEWSWADANPWQKLGDIGVALGLEWGGNWKRPAPFDRPHFQLTGGLTIGEAFRQYQQNKMVEDVWALLEARAKDGKG